MQQEAGSSLRIGIINLMPRAQSYEATLLRPLQQTGVAFEPLWIKLKDHAYASSDRQHIERVYQSFDAVLERGPLHGLLLSGAPVEELGFAEITYWPELVDILGQARERITSTLGLCWGGLALAHMLGIHKVNLDSKLFGVFPLRRLNAEPAPGRSRDDELFCPQSRHAGITDAELEAASADGRVRLLAHSAAAGYSIFESCDRRFLMHLGHPEYEPERLVFEYERDRAAGRR